jgi:hypothetical protein
MPIFALLAYFDAIAPVLVNPQTILDTDGPTP